MGSWAFFLAFLGEGGGAWGRMSPLSRNGRRAGERESAKNSLLDRAKELRRHQTDAERCLWYHLRAHHFMGMKFKRQVPISPCIVDFVSHENKLIIEVDGGQHQEHAEYDRRRDTWLKEQGFIVLRFWNHEVMRNIEGVLEAIRIGVQCSSPASSPACVPESGGARRSVASSFFHRPARGKEHGEARNNQESAT